MINSKSCAFVFLKLFQRLFIFRFWWWKIEALAKSGQWTELEAMAKSKKSPIGYMVGKFFNVYYPVDAFFCFSAFRRIMRSIHANGRRSEVFIEIKCGGASERPRETEVSIHFEKS